MTGISYRHGIHRHHIVWYVLALFWLCQQAAFAASVCAMPVPSAAATLSTSQPTCMGDMSVGHAKRLVCAQHCAQGTAIQSDATSPNVPGSLLPPLAPDAPVVAMLPRAEVSFASTDREHVYRPPLRLLFCSLLI
ncbi:MAG: hypothetical protein ABI114_00010 [Rhodanobacter sp.]